MIKLPNTFKIKDNIYNINKISVLQNFNKEHFYKEPYPYLVIKDCLPEDIYEHLENNYPSDQDIFNLDNNSNNKNNMYHNTRYQINSSTVLNLNNTKVIDPIWDLFIKYHTSELFFNEIKKIFGNHIKKCDIIKNKLIDYKIKNKITTSKINFINSKIKKKSNINNDDNNDLLKNLITDRENNKKLLHKKNNINDLSIGVRKMSKSDILLDCQIGINSPCKKLSSVKGPHIDNLSEIYAGLFYMKQKNDIGTGGDLVIYETIKKYNSLKKFIKDNPFIKINKIIDDKPFIESRGFNEKKIKKVKTIKYDRNTFVLFISTIDSIHSVSTRSENKVSRRLVNIIAESYSKFNNERFMC